MECVCRDIEHVFNIILGKETGTTFPIGVQDKEVNALLDTGAEKSCISMDIFVVAFAENEDGEENEVFEVKETGDKKNTGTGFQRRQGFCQYHRSWISFALQPR